MSNSDPPHRATATVDQEDLLLERLAVLADQRNQLADQLARTRVQAAVLADCYQTLDRSLMRALLGQLYRRVRQLFGRPNPPTWRDMPIIHFLDTPQIDAMLFGSLEVYGWAISHLGLIDRIEVRLDSNLLGTVMYGLPRVDSATYLGNPALRDCGYSGRFVVPADLDPTQPHSVSVCAIDTQGNQHRIDRPLLMRQQNYQRWLQQQLPTTVPAAGDHVDLPHYRVVAWVGAANQSDILRFVARIIEQSYQHWQLELVVDPAQGLEVLGALDFSDQRISVRTATLGDLIHSAAQLVQPHNYLIVIDMSWLLAPQALSDVTGAVLRSELPAVVYGDHDRMLPGGERVEPCFKPDWSIEYFRQSAYVGQPLCIQQQMVERLSRDDAYATIDLLLFDLLLRVAEQNAAIVHVPAIVSHHLYPDHKDVLESGQRITLLHAHLDRMAIGGAQIVPAGNYLHMRPAPIHDGPLVSIIIPTRNAPHLLKRCLQTIYATTTYRPFEVIVVDNETDDPIALDVIQRYPVVHVRLPNPFNYSRANNVGVQHAQGQYLLFLNNDTEIVSPEWIEQLLYYACQPDVGAVGALLLYPNRTVQHVGVVLGMNTTADHVLRGFPLREPPLDDALICARERSAVTAACLMVKRGDYHQVGGFDQQFKTHFQDVDLCLRLLAIGKRNLVTPQAILIHHESVTRKYEPDSGDELLLKERWAAQLAAADPYFHPSYDRHALNLALNLTY